MRECKTEALVVGLMDYGEADRIATILTLEHGKVRGLARSARKSRKRFGGALELFAHLRIRLRVREGLSSLEDADIISIHGHIRSDLDKISYAGYACELVDRLVPEAVANPRLFRLLNAYLERLDSSPWSPSDRRFFEVNLLNILGYRPPLDCCCGCGSSLEPSEVDSFRLSGARILCRSCGGGARTISAGAVSSLRRSLATGRFGSVQFSPQDLRDAGDLLDASIAEHLNRPLKSLAFLAGLTAESPS